MVVESIPEDVRKLVEDKPVHPVGADPPREGWEALDIVEQRPPEAQLTIKTTKGEYLVNLTIEILMVSRNTKFKTLAGEPLYAIAYIEKASWKPARKNNNPKLLEQVRATEGCRRVA